jgi:hypothetical protein
MQERLAAGNAKRRRIHRRGHGEEKKRRKRVTAKDAKDRKGEGEEF